MSNYPFPVDDAEPPSCHQLDRGVEHGAMVLRRNKADGSRFWGCRRWPDCSATVGFDAHNRHEAERLGYVDDEEMVRWDQ